MKLRNSACRQMILEGNTSNAISFDICYYICQELNTPFFGAHSRVVSEGVSEHMKQYAAGNQHSG